MLSVSTQCAVFSLTVNVGQDLASFSNRQGRYRNSLQTPNHILLIYTWKLHSARYDIDTEVINIFISSSWRSIRHWSGAIPMASPTRGLALIKAFIYYGNRADTFPLPLAAPLNDSRTDSHSLWAINLTDLTWLPVACGMLLHHSNSAKMWALSVRHRSLWISKL